MTNIVAFQKLMAGSSEVKDIYRGAVHIAHMWVNTRTQPDFTAAGVTNISITSGTVVAVASAAGQTLTLGATVRTATAAGSVLRVSGTGTAVLSSGTWSKVTVVAGTYSGPPFSGAGMDLSDASLIDSYSGKPYWTGAANASTSKLWGAP